MIISKEGRGGGDMVYSGSRYIPLPLFVRGFLPVAAIMELNVVACRASLRCSAVNCPESHLMLIIITADTWVVENGGESGSKSSFCQSQQSRLLGYRPRAAPRRDININQLGYLIISFEECPCD
jgi:hypothetical protein